MLLFHLSNKERKDTFQSVFHLHKHILLNKVNAYHQFRQCADLELIDCITQCS